MMRRVNNDKLLKEEEKISEAFSKISKEDLMELELKQITRDTYDTIKKDLNQYIK